MKSNFFKKTAVIVVATLMFTVVLSSCHSAMKCPTYSKADVEQGHRV